MNRHAWSRCVTLALALLGASGCAVSRHHEPPLVATVPDMWSRTTSPQPAAVDLSAWWGSFHDPTLTEFVEATSTENFDVRTAVSRVREARASAGAQPTVYPTASVGASTAVSGAGSDGGTRQTGVSRSYSVSADASWSIDVFGSIRNSLAAALATLEARGADLQDVQRTVEADVASQYVRIRSLQQRLAIATKNEASQQETWELTGFRAQAGLGTSLEVDQARANLESTRASAATLRLDLSQGTHALSILLGRSPASLDQRMTQTGNIPETDPAIAVGLPADTVRRRPDVRAAEHTLAARTFDVGVARAALYPSFSLAGSIGLETVSLARLLLPGAGFWRLTPSTTVNVFNRRQLRETIAVKTEAQAQALIGYESAVASALRDVEDALVALAEDQARRDRLTDAAAAATRAADTALQMYNAGLKDFRDVLDAQRTLFSLEDSLVSSRASVTLDVIALYRAVGGGWK